MNETATILRFAARNISNGVNNEFFFPSSHVEEKYSTESENEDARRRERSLLAITMGGYVNKYELAEVIHYIGDMLEE